MPIFKRGSSYMVSVGSGYNRFRQTYKTKLEAEVAEKEALLRLETTGTPLVKVVTPEVPKGHTLKDAHDLTWRMHWSQDKAPETHKHACTCIFRVIPSQTYLVDISPEMVLEAVEEWEDEGNSGGTVNRKVSHLNTMLTTAHAKGWISGVPKLPRRREGKHRIRWMTPDEEFKVLSMCQHLGLDELRELIIVATDTGFRRGELLGLVPSDFVNGLVHLHHGHTKSDKARSVPATKRVAEILSRRSNHRTIFQITTASLRHQWMLLKDALGLEEDKQFVFHMLRHTCASRLVQRAVPLAVVQQWMGHSNIATTLRYAHLAPESLMVGLAALEQVNPQPTLRVVNG